MYYATGDTIPKRFKSAVSMFPQNTATLTKNVAKEFIPTTYKDFYTEVSIFGSALLDMGVKRGDFIGIISDNRKEWMITDLGILSIGAVNVPRGADSTNDEIAYILGHADCRMTFAENSTQANKILTKKMNLPLLEKIILFDDEKSSVNVPSGNSVEILTFAELFERGKTVYQKNPNRFEEELEKGQGDDLATLIYTSGTTGEPKGVMLTHTSFVFQLDRALDHIDVKPTHKFLAVLPIWHSYERAVEYVIINAGATIAYSKLIGAIMIEDMSKVRPQWMASAPRIWESVRAGIYRKINEGSGAKKAIAFFFIWIGKMFAHLRNMFLGLLPQFKKRFRPFDILISFIPLLLLLPGKLLGDIMVFKKFKALLGGEFIAGISGGGALPAYVDKFFQAAGILLLEGYGLTETAPILAVRKQRHPVSGTVGPLFRDIEYRVYDEKMNEQPPGKKGTLYVKSDQVMKGYYKKPEKTAEVLKDGWLNTGDIAVFTHTGEFSIIGREKETIVLMGGENVEPVPIEDKLKESELIEQVMVVGQDQKYLGALIDPNHEKLEEIAKEANIPFSDWNDLCSNTQIVNIVNTDVQNLVNSKTGFKTFERIVKIHLLSKPFEVDDEMTKLLKVKRNVVAERYKKEIQKLFE